MLRQAFFFCHLAHEQPVDLAHGQAERARVVDVAQGLELRHLEHRVVHLVCEAVECGQDLGEVFDRACDVAVDAFDVPSQGAHEFPPFPCKLLVLCLDAQVLQLEAVHLVRNLALQDLGSEKPEGRSLGGLLDRLRYDLLELRGRECPLGRFERESTPFRWGLLKLGRRL